MDQLMLGPPVSGLKLLRSQVRHWLASNGDFRHFADM
jgi:hypothetical protein